MSNPFSINLVDPKVRNSAGELQDYFCINNSSLTRIKRALLDDSIYDVEDTALALSDRLLVFTGFVIGPEGDTLNVYNETPAQGKLLLTTVIASVPFEFTAYLQQGRNKIWVETTDELISSNIIHIGAYNLHAWLCVIAEEALTVRTGSAQVKYDSVFGAGLGYDPGTVISPTSQGLKESQGQFVSLQPSDVVSNWQTSLSDVLGAHNIAPSSGAMNIVTEIFTGAADSDYIAYQRENRLQRPSWSSGGLDPVVLAPGGSTVTQWGDATVHLYNRWWFAESANTNPPAWTTRYVYFERAGNVQVFPISPVVTATYGFAHLTVDDSPPLATGVIPIAETIDSTFIKTDTWGTQTGLSGQLYVRASYPVYTLSEVSGSVIDAALTQARPVYTGGSYIHLGAAQLGKSKASDIGNIYLEYTTKRDIYEVCAIHTSDATTVTGLSTAQRWNEMDGIYRDWPHAQHAGEIRVPFSQGLNDEQRADFQTILKEMKPPHKLFYLFLEDASTGEFTYYGNV